MSKRSVEGKRKMKFLENLDSNLGRKNLGSTETKNKKLHHHKSKTSCYPTFINCDYKMFSSNVISRLSLLSSTSPPPLNTDVDYPALC
jgi:hypothetical protein